MNTTSKLVLGAALLLLAGNSHAQADAGDDNENFRMTALEALITAPPERALPIVNKVLAGNHSAELKERALFILSQVDTPEAQARLLAFAKDSQGGLQAESIRMIGIGGDKDALAALGELYRDGSPEIKEAVLEAYLISDDADAVYEIAANTQNEEEFSEAVTMLGAMGAREQLRKLRDSTGNSESLMEAYFIMDDAESLLEIYRGSNDPELKRQLLEYLVMMDNDAVWDLIDNAFEGSE